MEDELIRREFYLHEKKIRHLDKQLQDFIEFCAHKRGEQEESLRENQQIFNQFIKYYNLNQQTKNKTHKIFSNFLSPMLIMSLTYAIALTNKGENKNVFLYIYIGTCLFFSILFIISIIKEEKKIKSIKKHLEMIEKESEDEIRRGSSSKDQEA